MSSYRWKVFYRQHKKVFRNTEAIDEQYIPALRGEIELLTIDRSRVRRMLSAYGDGEDDEFISGQDYEMAYIEIDEAFNRFRNEEAAEAKQRKAASSNSDEVPWGPIIWGIIILFVAVKSCGGE